MDKRLCIATATPSRTKHILKSSYLNWCGLFLWVIIMTIQSVNLTVPGGDTPRSAFTKINSNFADQTNAASRLVGTDGEKLVPANKVHEVALNNTSGYSASGINLNDLTTGSVYQINGASTNRPPDNGGYPMLITTQVWATTELSQLATSWTGTRYVRTRDRGGVWLPWRSITQDSGIYATTTASGANVVVDSTGRLTRAASSERYKDIIADLELDDEHYADAMSLNPIIYRSKSEIDNPNYHYYSFSAEALGAYDPAFTLWRDTETVTDDEGNTSEQPLDERQAEGINLNAIVAFLHATNVKQDKLIKDLQDQVNALKPAQQSNN